MPVGSFLLACGFWRQNQRVGLGGSTAITHEAVSPAPTASNSKQLLLLVGLFDRMSWLMAKPT